MLHIYDMKNLFLAGSVLLVSIAAYGQVDDPISRTIQTQVTTPELLEYSIIDSASVSREYHDFIYRSTGNKKYNIDPNYRYDSKLCGEQSPLACRVKPDSFLSFYTPFSRIGGVDTVHFNKSDWGLVVYGGIPCYGSGGGTNNDGLMVVRLKPDPVLLFQIFYSCGREEFAHGITEAEADAETFSYVRNVTVLGQKIIVSPNTRQFSKIHKDHGTCEITDIASGTYVYHAGKYVRQKPQRMCEGELRVNIRFADG